MGRSAIPFILLMALQRAETSVVMEQLGIILRLNWYEEFISRKISEKVFGVSKDESILEREGSRLYFYRWQRWNNMNLLG